jgi:hypothetical protein
MPRVAPFNLSVMRKSLANLPMMRESLANLSMMRKLLANLSMVGKVLSNLAMPKRILSEHPVPGIALLALLCLALVAPALGVAPLWTHTASEPVGDCAVSSDGKVVVVSNDLVHIFNRNGTLVDTAWPANDVALPPKASLIAAATDDGVRAILKNGTDLWTAGPNRSVAVAVSSDGKTVAGLTPGGFLSVYGSNGKRAGAAETGSQGDIVDLAASENGSVIVSIDGGGVRAFTRKAADRWTAELATPSALAMNGSCDIVAVGDGGSVKFYDLADTACSGESRIASHAR